jgi:hypothetical protein
VPSKRSLKRGPCVSITVPKHILDVLRGSTVSILSPDLNKFSGGISC